MNLTEYRYIVINSVNCPSPTCNAEKGQACLDSNSHQVFYVHDDRSLAHLNWISEEAAAMKPQPQPQPQP